MRWSHSALLGVLALSVGISFAFLTPAHSEVDQNAYLVSGRLLAEGGSPALASVNPDTGRVDPFLFVCKQWVGAKLGTSEERYYPKYPPGVPALVALACRVGGVKGAYWISPIATALGIVGMYLMARRVAGGYAGFLAAVILATSPVCLGHATNPNSHATAMCLAVWGMYLVVGEMASTKDTKDTKNSQPGTRKSPLSPWLAGLLLGLAATVRYSEGLLVIPLLLAIVLGLQVKDLRSWLRAFLLIGGWLIPVLALACFNLRTIGTVTGYDPTNESSGFTLRRLAENWQLGLRQIHDTGLFFILPLSLAGWCIMLVCRWRLALVMAGWIVPTVILYGGYYWSMEFGLGYLRFFLPILPGLALCAVWPLGLLKEWQRRPAAGSEPRRLRHIRAGCALAAGAVVAVSIVGNLTWSLPRLAADQHTRLLLADTGDEFLRTLQRQHCPSENALLFADEDSLLHHMQFVTRCRCYHLARFSRGWIAGLRDIDPDAPQEFDPNRREALAARLQEMLRERLGAATPAQYTVGWGEAMQKLADEERQNTVLTALAHGRRVFALLRAGHSWPSQDRNITARVVASWHIELERPPDTNARGSRTVTSKEISAWQVVELGKR